MIDDYESNPMKLLTGLCAIVMGIRVWEMLNVRILITTIYCSSHVMANTLPSLFHFVLIALSHSIVIQYIY